MINVRNSLTFLKQKDKEIDEKLKKYDFSYEKDSIRTDKKYNINNINNENIIYP